MTEQQKKIYLTNAIEYLLVDMSMTVDEVCKATGMKREELKDIVGDELENYELAE